MIKEVGIDLRPDLTIEGVTCGREVGCGCSHLGKWGYPVISSKDVSRIGNRGGSGRGGGSRGGLGLYWEVFWLVAFWKLRFRAAVEGGVVSAKAGHDPFILDFTISLTSSIGLYTAIVSVLSTLHDFATFDES
ncbi:unnamed protein product [Hymenolepis diminuta]|uniref:Uncharacterized protein n=1 Tax=Hymenolepis diminuta TaxID=6216 RepID=A0A564ZAR5_HYMDI|nr:unnamed protein product [Hymenolepis diminuta]